MTRLTDLRWSRPLICGSAQPGGTGLQVDIGDTGDGGVRLDSEQDPALCWECERMTDWPTLVTLHTEVGRVGRLLLCPTCYRMHYLPLAADAAGTMRVEAYEGWPVQAC